MRTGVRKPTAVLAAGLGVGMVWAAGPTAAQEAPLHEVDLREAATANDV